MLCHRLTVHRGNGQYGNDRFRSVLYAAYSFLAGLCLCSSWALGQESGPPIHFYADMSPEEQSAVTISPAVGLANFVLERDTLRFSWTIEYRDLTSPATIVGVHGPQAPGNNAGLLFSLGESGLKSPIEGSTVLTEGELEYLLTGRMYVNLRTQKYELGELRGQIMRLRPGQRALLSGGEIIVVR